MKLRISAFLLVIFFAIAAAYADKADDIIQKSLKARGSENFKNWKSYKFVATISQMGQEMKMKYFHKKPDKYRTEIDLMGKQILTVYDGKEGWMVNPMMGSDEPQQIPAEAIDQIKTQSDMFESPLVNYKERGIKVKYVGNEKVDDKETFKLIITDKNKEETTLFINTKDYLPLKVVKEVSVQGKKITVISIMKDYRTENGMMIPHLIDSDTGGMKSTVKISDIGVDIALDDSIFKKPAAKPKSK